MTIPTSNSVPPLCAQQQRLRLVEASTTSVHEQRAGFTSAPLCSGVGRKKTRPSCVLRNMFILLNILNSVAN